MFYTITTDINQHALNQYTKWIQVSNEFLFTAALFSMLIVFLKMVFDYNKWDFFILLSDTTDFLGCICNIQKPFSNYRMLHYKKIQRSVNQKQNLFDTSRNTTLFFYKVSTQIQTLIITWHKVFSILLLYSAANKLVNQWQFLWAHHYFQSDYHLKNVLA